MIDLIKTWTECNATPLFFELNFNSQVPASVEHEVVHGEEQMPVLIRIWHQVVLIHVKLQEKLSKIGSIRKKMEVKN